MWWFITGGMEGVAGLYAVTRKGVQKRMQLAAGGEAYIAAQIEKRV